jgi:superfamily II DNA helicase RecQ
VFLQSDSAAEIVLGILGDFGGKSPETVIPQLVKKVVECAKTDLEQLKFLQHLRIFGKLRNFGPLINHIMENTIAYFGLKDEDDYMYKRGAAKVETRLQKEMAAQQAAAQKRLEQNQRFTVIGLLDITTLSEVQMITSFGVSAEMIHGVKKDLAAAPKKIARLKEKMSVEQIAQQLNLPLNWVEKHI